MLDGISQSLVNMASKVGKGDLDKGVVVDTQAGKFAVNRNADQMGLGDHNFFQNETPTELGRQNAIIRGLSPATRTPSRMRSRAASPSSTSRRSRPTPANAWRLRSGVSSRSSSPKSPTASLSARLRRMQSGRKS